MDDWIKFMEGQIKQKDGRFKYEANTKFRITESDEKYYYIGKDRFDKYSNIVEAGKIEKENIKKDWR